MCTTVIKIPMTIRPRAAPKRAKMITVERPPEASGESLTSAEKAKFNSAVLTCVVEDVLIRQYNWRYYKGNIGHNDKIGRIVVEIIAGVMV